MAGMVRLDSAVARAASGLGGTRPAPYSSVRNDVIDHPDLIPRDVQVFALLDRKARGNGSVVVSARDCAETLRVHVRTVARSFARLSDAGVIMRRRRYRVDGSGQAWDLPALTILVGCARHAYQVLASKRAERQAQADALAEQPRVRKPPARLGMTRSPAAGHHSNSSRGEPPGKPPDRHRFDPDEHGLSCSCNLPEAHPVHTPAVTLATH